MSKQTPHQVKANVTYPGKDIFQVYQRNFGKYFTEIEKTVPQNFRSVSSYQITFLDAWKNAVETVLDVQRKYAQKAQINTQIPEPASKAFDKAIDGLIQSRTIQDQFVNATLDATEKNIKSFYESAEDFAEFQNNLIESWFTSFKNVKN